MKLIWVALIYAQSLAGHVAEQAWNINQVFSQVGMRVQFIYQQIPEIPCQDAGDIYDVLFCMKEKMRRYTLPMRDVPAYPMTVIETLPNRIIGAFAGEACKPIGRRGAHAFLAMALQGDPEQNANVMAHELLHAFGARHQAEWGDIMHPFGGQRRISDVWVSEATKRQVKRCLARMRYLQRGQK